MDKSEDISGDIPQVRLGVGLAYDGSGYRGFAKQNGFRTVAGDFIHAFTKITNYSPAIVCAGRTDAGVHALGQFLHFDFPARHIYKNKPLLLKNETPDTITTLQSWKRSLGKILGRECTLFELGVMPDNFDARRSAVYRRYYYDIDISRYEDPRLRGLCWHVGQEINLDDIKSAIRELVGEHNFAAFCRRPPNTDKNLPIVRRVDSAEIHVLEIHDHKILRFEIQANAFCHQMIRSIVGLLMMIGLGAVKVDMVYNKINEGTRDAMPTLAPPEGLCLIEVGYPDEFGGPRSLLRLL